MTVPSESAFLDYGKEIVVLYCCTLDPVANLLISNMLLDIFNSLLLLSLSLALSTWSSKLPIGILLEQFIYR